VKREPLHRPTEAWAECHLWNHGIYTNNWILGRDAVKPPVWWCGICEGRVLGPEDQHKVTDVKIILEHIATPEHLAEEVLRKLAG